MNCNHLVWMLRLACIWAIKELINNFEPVADKFVRRKLSFIKFHLLALYSCTSKRVLVVGEPAASDKKLNIVLLQVLDELLHAFVCGCSHNQEVVMLVGDECWLEVHVCINVLIDYNIENVFADICEIAN